MGELNMPSFDTPNPITATISVVAGDVRVTAGDAGATTVTVEPTDASNAADRWAALRRNQSSGTKSPNARPARFLDRANLKAGEFAPQAFWNTLIKEEAHGPRRVSCAR